MKFLVFLFLLGFTFFCQSPQVVPPNFPTRSETVNLNAVKMVTRAESLTNEGKKPLTSEPGIPVEFFEGKLPYISLDLYFADSGIHIIEEILSGTILRHQIVVLNQKGETIAKQPVNFQAYEVLETKTEVQRNKVIVGESNRPVKVNSISPETSVRREALEKQYSDQDTIPQVLEILDNKVPNPGEYISIFLELVYIVPELLPNCEPKTEECESIKRSFFEEAARRNREEMSRLKGSYLRGNVEPFRNLSAEEQAIFRKSVKNKIQESNGVFGPKINYSKYAFREWTLVSAPRFFKIIANNKTGKANLTIEEPQNEKSLSEEKANENQDSIFDSPTHPRHKKRIITTP